MSPENQKLKLIRYLASILKRTSQVSCLNDTRVCDTSGVKDDTKIHVFRDAWVIKKVADECVPDDRKLFYALVLKFLGERGDLSFGGSDSDWNYLADMRNGFKVQFELLRGLDQAYMSNMLIFETGFVAQVKPEHAQLWLAEFAQNYKPSPEFTNEELELMTCYLLYVACGRDSIIGNTCHEVSMHSWDEKDSAFVLFLLKSIRHCAFPW